MVKTIAKASHYDELKARLEKPTRRKIKYDTVGEPQQFDSHNPDSIHHCTHALAQNYGYHSILWRAGRAMLHTLRPEAYRFHDLDIEELVYQAIDALLDINVETTDEVPEPVDVMLKGVGPRFEAYDFIEQMDEVWEDDDPDAAYQFLIYMTVLGAASSLDPDDTYHWRHVDAASPTDFYNYLGAFSRLNQWMTAVFDRRCNLWNRLLWHLEAALTYKTCLKVAPIPMSRDVRDTKRGVQIFDIWSYVAPADGELVFREAMLLCVEKISAMPKMRCGGLDIMREWALDPTKPVKEVSRTKGWGIFKRRDVPKSQYLGTLARIWERVERLYYPDGVLYHARQIIPQTRRTLRLAAAAELRDWRSAVATYIMQTWWRARDNTVDKAQVRFRKVCDEWWERCRKQM